MCVSVPKVTKIKLHSPVAMGALVGLTPKKRLAPKLKYETINQWCYTIFGMSSPLQKHKVPLLKTFQ